MPALLRNAGSFTPEPSTGIPGILLSSREIARPFLDATLKLFPYFGGKYAVDIMITGFQAGNPVQSPEMLGQWFEQNWAQTIKRRSNQAALTVVEEARGLFQELKSPSQYRVLVSDVGQVGQERQDREESRAVADVQALGIQQSAQQLTVAGLGQTQGVSLSGRGARFSAPLQQPGADQPIDRRVEAAIADRPGVARQVLYPVAQLIAVQRALGQKSQDR